MKPKYPSLLFPLLLVLYEIANYLSNDMYLPALPNMMHDLQLSTHQAQLTLTVWFLGSALTPLILGALADRWGRRLVLLSGGVIYVISTVACALTTTDALLLIARFVEGAAVPAMMVAGYATIHESYEQTDAIRMLALMGSISVLAPTLGPLLGGVILLFSNWRVIFWVIAIWSAASLVLLYYYMPETLPAEKREPLQYKKLFNNYWRILTNQRYMLLMLVFGFMFIGFIMWVTTSPLLIIQSFHQTAIVYGVIQAIVFAAFIAGNQFIKRLLDHFNISLLILSGLSVALAGALLTLIVSLFAPHSLYAFVAAMSMYSFGTALCFAPLNRLIIETSDVAMGIRVSMFTVTWTGFAALGSWIASLFFNGTTFSLAIMIALTMTIGYVLKWWVD